MPKEDVLEYEGVVLEILPNAMFKVKLDNDHEILAHGPNSIGKIHLSWTLNSQTRNVWCKHRRESTRKQSLLRG